MNDDVIPGFDASSQSAHLRLHHDTSLDSPHIVLERVAELQSAIILRLSRTITENGHGFFKERFRRAENAGFKYFILECSQVVPELPGYWWPVVMPIVEGKDVYLVGLKEGEKELIRRLWGDAVDPGRYRINVEEAVRFICTRL
jgi:hypothetical protein